MIGHTPDMTFFLNMFTGRRQPPPPLLPVAMRIPVEFLPTSVLQLLLSCACLSCTCLPHIPSAAAASQ